MVSDAKEFGTPKFATCVLILVVMEYGLRPSCFRSNFANNVCVLILVVMEYGLRQVESDGDDETAS